MPASYRRPLERLDQRRGSAAGATGPLVARLNGYGELLCLVAGAWGDCSTHLYELIITCAESCVAHPCRSTGRPEMDSQLGVITGQYRRLLSSCIVRAQAQHLISRIGVISPEARVAAQRWEVVGRLERESREERRSHKKATCHWQASEGRVGQEGTLPRVLKTYHVKLWNKLCVYIFESLSYQ